MGATAIPHAHASAMHPFVGTGHLVSWDGGCMFIGRAHREVPMHAHYAIQIAFGATSGIRFRAADDEDWTGYDGVVIPSRQPHAMDASVVPGHAVIFVEPETREGRALAERHLRGGITGLPAALFADAAETLFAAYTEARTTAAVTAAARAVVRALAGGIAPTVASDPRILRATAYVNAHLDAPLTLDAVAAEACLSPSRFRHLFVEQIGMGLRAYVLWRRFLHVWTLLGDGATLSAAAHAAGFADAAHLSRTSRSMFGFPPSALQLAEQLAPAAEARG